MVIDIIMDSIPLLLCVLLAKMISYHYTQRMVESEEEIEKFIKEMENGDDN